MNRKLVALVVAAAVIGVVVWFAFLRHRGDHKPPQLAGSGRTGSAAVQRPAEPTKPDDAPRGGAPQFILDLDPEGPLTLAGQVVGPDGKGIGGAEVWLGSNPPRSTTAEDDGSFTFEKLVGRTYQLSARSGDLVGEARYKLIDKGDPVVIHVTAGASVVVTVSDDNKQPVSGAEVKLGELAHRTQKTDAKGEATLAPITPGWVSVQATAPGFAPATATASVGSSGATGRLAIRLRKGFTVSGRVVDEGGKPIAKARITARGLAWTRPDDDATGSVSTDAKGKFTIAALPAGTHMVTVVDEVHAPATSAPFVIADKPVTDLEITMKEGGVIAGIVLDTAQKPVPFATVRVAGQGEQLWSVMARQATSDEAGAFQLRGLTRTKLQVRAESDSAASKLVPVDLTEQVAKRDLKLVLDVAGSIAGVVVDEKGAPVPEVSVNVFPDMLKGASLDMAAIGAMSSAITDGAGAFSVNGLPDGPYKVWAARANSGREWGQHGVAAKSGDKHVRLVLAAFGGIKGKIAIAGADQPPKVAMVRIGSKAATPAYDGVFELKDVAAGKWDVTFSSTEFATFIQQDVAIESGKTSDLGTITVHRGRKLVGKVVDGSGAPIAGARVRVAFFVASTDNNEDDDNNDGDGGVRSAVSDRDGGFSIIGIPAQATTAVAEHTTRGRSAAVSVPAGTDDPPSVQLALVGFGSITGKVTMKGKPMPKIGISASTKGGGAQASFAQTDDNGNFKLAKVPEGTVSVQVIRGEAMSMKTHAVSVQVAAGQDTKTTIEIPVGQIALTVQPKALASNTVDAAQVFVFDGTVVIANAKQLIDGMFSGGAQANKIWLGVGTPFPTFGELLPGDKSICTIPITGNLSDPTFQARMGQHRATLKVYCKALKVPATPLAQTVVHEVPSMTPLPN
ncbi:MAG: carboxypeptidase regulatory-like domain-containing protein [Kofleriaceae bacterium]